MNIESLLTSAITWAFGQYCNELDSFKVSRDDLKHFAEHIVYTIEESNNKRQISILTDELSSRISPIHREADDEGEMSVYKLTDKEYKDLLVKDLYARLPHGVMVHLVDDGFATVARLDRPTMDFIEAWEIKPYLRPVSSMTDAEMDKLFDILHVDKEGKDDDWIKINDDLGIKFFLPTGRWMEEMDFALDYLRSIHIDIYNFIGKKMAIEAPEGMYE